MDRYLHILGKSKRFLLIVILTSIFVFLGYFPMRAITPEDSVYFYQRIDEVLELRKKNFNKADSLVNTLIDFARSKNYRSEYAYALYTKSRIRLDVMMFDGVDSLAQLALRLFRELHSEREVSMALMLLGNWNLSTGRLDSAKHYFDKAFEIKRIIGDEEGLAFCYNAYGIISDYKADYHQAVENYQKAIPIFEKYKNWELLSDVYNNLSVAHSNLKNYAFAIDYAKKAIELNKKIDYEYRLLYNYVCMAFYYSEIDSLDAAKDFAMRALNTSNALGDASGRLYAYSSLGDLYLKRNVLDSAEVYYKKFLMGAPRLFGDFEVGSVQINLAKVYFKKKKYRLVSPLLDSAIDLLTPFSAKKELSEAYDFLARNMAALGRYADAYRYARLSDSLQNSYLNDEQLKQIQELTMRFQVEKKEAENELLKKEKELQERMLRMRSYYLYFSLAGLGLVLALLGLTYKNYRQKLRANRLLSEQNEQIVMLSREKSHRFKNNLQLLSAMMEMQIRRLESPELKEVVKESENRVRAISLLERELQVENIDQQVLLNQYLGKIIHHIWEFYTTSDKHFDVKVNIADIKIDAEKAMRLGLIMNELMINSIKHAFSRQKNPLIHIELWREKASDVRILYRDNGTGIDLAIQPDEVRSLGLRLIRNMVKQLHGHLEIENDNGAVFSFYFPNLLKIT